MFSKCTCHHQYNVAWCVVIFVGHSCVDESHVTYVVHNSVSDLWKKTARTPSFFLNICYAKIKWKKNVENRVGRKKNQPTLARCTSTTMDNDDAGWDAQTLIIDGSTLVLAAKYEFHSNRSTTQMMMIFFLTIFSLPFAEIVVDALQCAYCINTYVFMYISIRFPFICIFLLLQYIYTRYSIFYSQYY